MKTCKDCGEDQPEKVSVCPNCEEPLATVVEPVTPPNPARSPDTEHGLLTGGTKRPPTMKTFYIKSTDGDKGPFILSQLRSMWDNGAITADTLYRTDESQKWHSLAEEFSKTTVAPFPLIYFPSGSPTVEVPEHIPDQHFFGSRGFSGCSVFGNLPYRYWRRRRP
jgi:hypothetical protein